MKFFVDKGRAFVRADAIELYTDDTRERFNTEFRMSQKPYKDSVEMIEKELGIWRQSDETNMDCDETETNNAEQEKEYKQRKIHIQKLMLQCLNDLQTSLHDSNSDRAKGDVKNFQLLVLPELTTLMLLKFPEVVETFYSIECVAGNRNKLEINCQAVQEKVEQIFARIQVRLHNCNNKLHFKIFFIIGYVRFRSSFRDNFSTRSKRIRTKIRKSK